MSGTENMGLVPGPTHPGSDTSSPASPPCCSPEPAPRSVALCERWGDPLPAAGPRGGSPGSILTLSNLLSLSAAHPGTTEGTCLSCPPWQTGKAQSGARTGLGEPQVGRGRLSPGTEPGCCQDGQGMVSLASVCQRVEMDGRREITDHHLLGSLPLGHLALAAVGRQDTGLDGPLV
ncbi:unnamed protein product [Natator depressus]